MNFTLEKQLMYVLKFGTYWPNEHFHWRFGSIIIQINNCFIIYFTEEKKAKNDYSC